MKDDALSSVNGQIMIMGAHRYALGKRTYVVSSTIEWLKENWDIVSDNSRFTILRDTAQFILDNSGSEHSYVKPWRTFLSWGVKQEDVGFERKIQQAVRYNQETQIFPLDECGECGMIYYSCVCSHED